ncbi:MAG: hypothetical protein ACRD0K_19435 [Egibacteraceae bacterium]
MIRFENLYANFTHVCEEAGVRELEVMLRVLRNRLDGLHPAVAVKLSEALELLDEEIVRKGRVGAGATCKLYDCPRWHDTLRRHALPPR